MKYIKLIIIGLILPITTFSQTKDIEFEPRIGSSIVKSYRDQAHIGYNIGGMVSFPITDRFFIQSGLSFYSVKMSRNENASILHIPVYASYRIPIKNTLLRLSVGPYGQIGDGYDFGFSAEVGLEYRKWIGGINIFQNTSTESVTTFAGISLGYKFKLK